MGTHIKFLISSAESDDYRDILIAFALQQMSTYNFFVAAVSTDMSLLSDMPERIICTEFSLLVVTDPQAEKIIKLFCYLSLCCIFIECAVY